jgi:hypothetical protein
MSGQLCRFRGETKMALVAAAACAAMAVVSSSTQAMQNRPEPSVARLKQQLGERFQVNVLQIEGKNLQVGLNDREITEEIYLSLVTMTCTALSADARQFGQFEFGSRFADQGYTFESPAKCAEILKMPADRQKAAILADTKEL